MFCLDQLQRFAPLALGLLLAASAGAQTPTASPDGTTIDAGRRLFAIVGDVRQPGVYEAQQETLRLSELVERAGLAVTAGPLNIQILRQSGTLTQFYWNPATAELLRAGDVVSITQPPGLIVPKSAALGRSHPPSIAVVPQTGRPIVVTRTLASPFTISSLEQILSVDAAASRNLQVLVGTADQREQTIGSGSVIRISATGSGVDVDAISPIRTLEPSSNQANSTPAIGDAISEQSRENVVTIRPRNQNTLPQPSPLPAAPPLRSTPVGPSLPVDPPASQVNTRRPIGGSEPSRGPLVRPGFGSMAETPETASERVTVTPSVPKDAASSSRARAEVPAYSTQQNGDHTPRITPRTTARPPRQSSAPWLILGGIFATAVTITGVSLWNSRRRQQQIAVPVAQTTEVDCQADHLERLISGDWETVEEPVVSHAERFHGVAVGHKRMRIDPRHELKGPHFANIAGLEPELAHLGAKCRTMANVGTTHDETRLAETTQGTVDATGTQFRFDGEADSATIAERVQRLTKTRRTTPVEAEPAVEPAFRTDGPLERALKSVEEERRA